LHNQEVHCTTSTWDDNGDDYVEIDELFVENANNFDDDDVIESFVSSVESLIHDSSSHKKKLRDLKIKFQNLS
jgi:hypothetical protein